MDLMKQTRRLERPFDIAKCFDILIQEVLEKLSADDTELKDVNLNNVAKIEEKQVCDIFDSLRRNKNLTRLSVVNCDVSNKIMFRRELRHLQHTFQKCSKHLLKINCSHYVGVALVNIVVCPQEMTSLCFVCCLDK